jgi:hypothetical protein
VLRTQQALSRIAQVREAAEDVGSAYLLRTRLHRMLLSIQRGLAADLGLTVRAPCLLEVTPKVIGSSRRIVELCNSIILDTKHLSQRSESLDLRWQRDWRALQIKLDCLQEEILRYACETDSSVNTQVP